MPPAFAYLFFLLVGAGAAGLSAIGFGPNQAMTATLKLVRPLPVRIGRFRYRTGFVARRAAKDLLPFRALEQAVRDTALGRDP